MGVAMPAASAAVVSQTRSYNEVKGAAHNFRLEKFFGEKDQKAALDKYWSEYNEKQPKTYSSRKEQLAHLTERPSYEYVSDLQRAANDLTSVTSHPLQYQTDVPYHYNKVRKAVTFSKTNAVCGNGEIQMKRIVPQ